MREEMKRREGVEKEQREKVRKERGHDVVLVDDDDELAGLTTDTLRGYRTTAEGKKTTFFDRGPMSASDKALVGDFAPKRIDTSGSKSGSKSRSKSTNSNAPRKVGSTSTNSNAPKRIDNAQSTQEENATPSTETSPGAAASAPSTSSTSSSSVWNNQGAAMWEEKSATPWAISRLTELIRSATVQLPGGAGEVRVQSIESMEGEAFITFSRGKKRHVFEFNAQLVWGATLPAPMTEACADSDPAAPTELTGPFEMPDIGGDCDGEYDLVAHGDWEWTHEAGAPPSHTQKQLVGRCTRPDGALHRKIVQTIASFVAEFRAR
jgi:hypothetical protein